MSRQCIFGQQMMVISWLLIVLVSGCASKPPASPDNLCAIFEENRSWYNASIKASNRWGGPVHVPLAIMYQESAFKADARPPMRYFLDFIPYGRGSSAYGYAQAQTPAWKDYQAQAGSAFSDRDDFADAVDFVQWYMDKTAAINGVSKWDAYGQYLNYHEGWGGYARASQNSKPWLLTVAKKVEARSQQYASQFQGCKQELSHGWLYRLFF